MLRKLDMIESGRQLADHVAQHHFDEDFAVRYLADNAAQGDAEYLRVAVIEAIHDPDLTPLAVALLERAAERARNPPPPPKAWLPPDAGRFGR